MYRKLTLNPHLFCLKKIHLRQTGVFTFLYHRQKTERAEQRSVINSAEIKPPIGMIGSGINAKTAPIGWPIADRQEHVATHRSPLALVELKRKPGTTMISKEELPECGPIVKTHATHKWPALQAMRRHRDISIETKAKRIREITSIDLTSVHSGQCAMKRPLKRLRWIMR